MTETTNLHRTNINLYTTDVDYLQRRFGYGWTETVREWVHERVKMAEAAAKAVKEQHR